MNLETLLDIIRQENDEFSAEIYYTTDLLPNEAFYMGSYVKKRSRQFIYWHSTQPEPDTHCEVSEFSRDTFNYQIFHIIIGEVKQIGESTEEQKSNW